MRILHLSTHDVTGGAARAAYRLHAGLREIGHESRMLVLGRAGEDPTVLPFRPELGPASRLRRSLRRRSISAAQRPYRDTRPAGFEQFSDDRTEFGRELPEQLPACEVINLHWVAGFLDHSAFFARLPPQVPLVWTLHDMNAFTGGCHYDDRCGRFAGSCGACPQLGSDRERDLSREVWHRKQRSLARLPPHRLQVVADSHWLAEEARRSSLLGRFPIRVVHYGLDTEVFAPRPKAAARAALGIPAGAAVLLFVADSVDNRRKGFPVLLRALQGMGDRRDLFVVTIGRGTPSLPGFIPHLHIASVGDDRLLSLVYSAADLFVIPSLQEAYGQTALEALACETAVVGFDTGGIPDIVKRGVTGSLAPVGDAEALREAIASLLDAPEARAAMARGGRRMVLREHTLAAQARRYESIYRELIGPAREGAAPNRSPTGPGADPAPEVPGAAGPVGLAPPADHDNL
jgi:glycosyltransferase involved in cell wall biosynthesis